MVGWSYGESFAFMKRDTTNNYIDLGPSRGQAAFPRKEGRYSQ